MHNFITRRRTLKVVKKTFVKPDQSITANLKVTLKTKMQKKLQNKRNTKRKN